jgi:hypothetical protein
MKFIKLTSIEGGLIVVNVAHIGHLYPINEKVEYGRVAKKAHTRLGVTTHNNGGFSVTETVDEIMKLINKM